ncbi:MAG: hypothetical protein ACOYJF_03750 [Prevotella sp.]|jgi:hypothetical protein
MQYFRYALGGQTTLFHDKLNLAASYLMTYKAYLRRNLDTDEKLNRNHYVRNQFALSSYDFTPNTRISLSGWAELVREKSNGTVYHDHPFGGQFMFFHRYGNKGNWLRLNYNCNIEYPNQSASSSYGYFTDSLIWVGGNPGLKTGVVHDMRFWADFVHCYNVQCGVRVAPKAFCSITEMREGKLSDDTEGTYAATTTQNTHFTDWWASCSMTKRFLRDFVFKFDAKVDKLVSSYHEYHNHVYAYYLSTSLSYYCNKWDAYFMVMLRRNRDSYIGPQETTMNESEMPILYIRKFFLGERLSMELTYSNMFNVFSVGNKTRKNSPALVSYNFSNECGKSKNYIQFTVTYRFAGGKSVWQYDKQMSNEK